MKKYLKISRITAVNFFKLIFRSALFVCALVDYIFNYKHATGKTFGGMENNLWLLWGTCGVFVLERGFRFFPSKMESAGCQKQFACRFQKTEETKSQLQPWRKTFTMAIAWIFLNCVVFLLYFLNVIKKRKVWKLCKSKGENKISPFIVEIWTFLLNSQT